MIIKISDEYKSQLFEYFKGGVEMPIKNSGTNMSFIKYNDRYIFVCRNIYPIKNIIDKKKLIPGISQRSKNYLNKKMVIPFITQDNVSDYYLWDWYNTYEVSIIFVGNLDKNLNITFDSSVEPVALINSKMSSLYKQNDEIKKSKIAEILEDYRIYKFNKRIYLINSSINAILQLFLKNNSLKVIFKYNNICLPTINLNKKRILNSTNNNYYKIYEKNWTLYKLILKEKKESVFSFFHDFTKNGIEGVDYYPITNKCKKYILVRYPTNTLPINSDIVRFSFGSTSIYFKSSKYKGYLGVGHLKINLLNKNKSELTKQELHFNNLFFNLNTSYKKTFGKKFKPHSRSLYLMFFFLYDNQNNKFYISDFYIPIFKYKYIFNIIFPMSINEINNNIIISAGYGDYTNIFMKYTKKEIDDTPFYDITTVDVTKLKTKLLF
jgi:hypothetical protein